MAGQVAKLISKRDGTPAAAIEDGYGFYTLDEAKEAGQRLAYLGPAARRLMGVLVEEQEVTRTGLSPAAMALEDAGFAFVKDDPVFGGPARIRPSLAGEDALLWLDRARGGG